MNELFQAIVSGGVFLTFCASMLTLIVSIKNSRSTNYINKVIDNRITWINDVRRTNSEFINRVKINKNLSTVYNEEYFLRCQELYHRIHILMGHKFTLEADILTICKQLLDNLEKYMRILPNGDAKKLYKIENQSERLTQTLIKYIEAYLKYEWNRVKIEGTGKKYTKSENKKNIKMIMNEYDINIMPIQSLFKVFNSP